MKEGGIFPFSNLYPRLINLWAKVIDSQTPIDAQYLSRRLWANDLSPKISVSLTYKCVLWANTRLSLCHNLKRIMFICLCTCLAFVSYSLFFLMCLILESDPDHQTRVELL